MVSSHAVVNPMIAFGTSIRLLCS